jgi:hypothetical protein
MMVILKGLNPRLSEWRQTASRKVTFTSTSDSVVIRVSWELSSAREAERVKPKNLLLETVAMERLM